MNQRSIACGPLTGAQVGDVLALAEAAGMADGVAPLSEHTLLHLRYGDREPGRDLVLSAGGEIAGYAYADPPGARGADLSGELVIAPARRRQGLGLALLRAVIAEADGHTVRMWAHGDLPAAAGLARSAGFERFRALWQMRRSLRDPLAEPVFPAGSTLRTFVPGRDEQEWLDLNARAFAEHQEQGAWTGDDLELREREGWFDPAGFFIAERHGVMAGFHWTKIHGTKLHGPGEPDSESGGPSAADAPAGLGEVYVVGVDPGEQGTGLGRALTLAGLRYLRDRGLPEAMLYVDEDNAPAIRMYRALGFSRWRTDAMYCGPGRPAD
ncbi:MAG: mycothiol synthase [Streptosporangiaceae bacterium]